MCWEIPKTTSRSDDSLGRGLSGHGMESYPSLWLLQQKEAEKNQPSEKAHEPSLGETSHKVSESSPCSIPEAALRSQSNDS